MDYTKQARVHPAPACGNRLSDMQRHRQLTLAFILTITLSLIACGDSSDSAPSGAASTSSATVGQQDSGSAPSDVEPAPEFAAIEGWHNSEPLTLAGLRGSTVLIVFFSDT